MFIPENILEEILTRVPARDLVRYKTVCRQWRSLIDDPYFVVLQERRASKSILGTAKFENNINLVAFDDHIFFSSKRLHHIFDSSTGGFVCVGTGKNNYFICNPATGKFWALPRLPTNLYAYGMKLYPNPQTGKLTEVVALCGSNVPPRICYWATFTVGLSLQWKHWELWIRDMEAATWAKCIFCDSGPIWLTRYGEHQQDKFMEIHFFEVDLEKTSAHTTPFYFEHTRRVQVHEWDGKFAVSSVQDKEIITWVLEDRKKNLWRKEIVTLPTKEERGFNRIELVEIVQQGKMWLRTKRLTGDVFSVDLITKKVEKLIIRNALRLYNFEPYVGTLAKLDY